MVADGGTATEDTATEDTATEETATEETATEGTARGTRRSRSKQEFISSSTL